MKKLLTIREIAVFTCLTHLAVPFYNWPQHGTYLPALLLESLEMLAVVIITPEVVEHDRARIENQVVEIRKTDRRVYLAESH